MEKRHGKISASMMCSDLIHLKENIAVFERTGIEYLHIDVMDGEFVPNFGLGVDYLYGLRELTDIPMDLHLMVNRPEDKLGWLNIQPADRVHIHYESTQHVQRTVERVRRYGCKVMLAINPATPIYSTEEMLEYIDGVTVLTVNPGFAGQQIVRSCIKKTGRLKTLLAEMGFERLDVEVDGNISFENAKTLRGLGANIFVAGSSSIFPKRGIVSEEKVTLLRGAII